MTRINLVPVETLTRLHLIAEYAELPRIVSLVRRAQDRGETPASVRKRAPQSFTFGAGHAMFFYTRLTWLVNRYDQLVKEMQDRGYDPQYPSLNNRIVGIQDWWFNDYEPTLDEIALSQSRIDDRVANPVGRQRKAPSMMLGTLKEMGLD